MHDKERGRNLITTREEEQDRHNYDGEKTSDTKRNQNHKNEKLKWRDIGLDRRREEPDVAHAAIEAVRVKICDVGAFRFGGKEKLQAKSCEQLIHSQHLFVPTTNNVLLDSSKKTKLFFLLLLFLILKCQASIFLEFFFLSLFSILKF